MRGIVGAWMLNEGSGTRVFGYARNPTYGTLTGMDPATDWTTGLHGFALDLDGTDDWVDFGTNGWNTLLNASSGFTIALWFQAGTAPGTNQFRHTVCVSQNFGSTSNYIGLGSTATTNNFKILSNGETPGSGTALTAGTWYMGALTWNGSQFRPYLDGKLDYAAFTPSGSNWKTGATLALGREAVLGAAHHYHNGRVSDLRVFSRALGADELAALYRDPYAAWAPESPVFSFVSASAATALSVASMSHAHAIGAPSLAAVSPLSVDSAAHAQTIGQPSIAALAPLSVDDAAHGQAIGSPSLTVHAVLAVDASAHAHSIAAASLTVGGATALALADMAHAQAIGEPALAALSPIEPADMAHAHSTAAVTLVAQSALEPADIAHALAIAEPALVQAMAVASMAHASSSSSPAMTGHTVLVVDSALHAHLISAANVGVTGVIPAGEVVIVYADDLTVVVMADVSEVAASAKPNVITVQ